MISMKAIQRHYLALSFLTPFFVFGQVQQGHTNGNKFRQL